MRQLPHLVPQGSSASLVEALPVHELWHEEDERMTVLGVFHFRFGIFFLVVLAALAAGLFYLQCSSRRLEAIRNVLALGFDLAVLATWRESALPLHRRVILASLRSCLGCAEMGLVLVSLCFVPSQCFSWLILSSSRLRQPSWASGATRSDFYFGCSFP